MSAVVLNPPVVRPAAVVRIICSRCMGESAKHTDCPGVVYGRKVRFVCTCTCHRMPALAFKDEDVA